MAAVAAIAADVVVAEVVAEVQAKRDAAQQKLTTLLGSRGRLQEALQ